MAKKKKPISKEPWLRALARKSNKYKAIRTTFKGRVYASRMEATRAAELDAMQEAGKILFWIPQPGTVILDIVRYQPDYFVVGLNGEYWYEEVKGMMTPGAKMKFRLWVKYGPCDLHVITKKGNHIITPDRLSADEPDQKDEQE